MWRRKPLRQRWSQGKRERRLRRRLVGHMRAWQRQPHTVSLAFRDDDGVVWEAVWAAIKATPMRRDTVLEHG